MSYEIFIKSCYEQGIFTQHSILSYLSIKSFGEAKIKVDQLEKNRTYNNLIQPINMLINKNNVDELNEALVC